MELGFVAHYMPEIVRFAGEAGFDCLEVFCEMGSPMDITVLSDDDVRRLVDEFAEYGIRFGILSASNIHLAGDPVRRRAHNAYFEALIRRARSFGTCQVTTNAFGNPDLSPVENMAAFKQVFSEYAQVAEGEGVKITVENCPHWLGYPKRIGNIAFSPEMWTRIFDAVPSKALGLEFDPSHLVWEGMDYAKLIRRFGERIYAFHAKDTEVLEEERNTYGILGKQFDLSSEWEAGWWRYRIPGWGQVDWKQVFSALNDVGYDGPMMIEHEDPVFGGPRTNEGLKLGLRHLKSFLP